jgi:hypothetical protein
MAHHGDKLSDSDYPADLRAVGEFGALLIAGALFINALALPAWIDSLATRRTSTESGVSVTIVDLDAPVEEPFDVGIVAAMLCYSLTPALIFVVIVRLRTGTVVSVVLSTAASWLLIAFLYGLSLGDSYGGGIEAFGIACFATAGAIVVGPLIGTIVGIRNNRKWMERYPSPRHEEA